MGTSGGWIGSVACGCTGTGASGWNTIDGGMGGKPGGGMQGRAGGKGCIARCGNGIWKKAIGFTGGGRGGIGTAVGIGVDGRSGGGRFTS